MHGIPTMISIKLALLGIVDDFQGIISSAATILRVWDDLGSAKVILKTSLCSLAPHDHFLF